MEHLHLIRCNSQYNDAKYINTGQLSSGTESETLCGMLYSAQIRAARALLGWSQTQLARRAGLGLATLQRIERNEGIQKGKFSTVIKIQKALEQAGIHFIEDDTGEIGVRLKIKRP